MPTHVPPGLPHEPAFAQWHHAHKSTKEKGGGHKHEVDCYACLTQGHLQGKPPLLPLHVSSVHRSHCPLEGTAPLPPTPDASQANSSFGGVANHSHMPGVRPTPPAPSHTLPRTSRLQSGTHHRPALAARPTHHRLPATGAPAHRRTRPRMRRPAHRCTLWHARTPGSPARAPSSGRTWARMALGMPLCAVAAVTRTHARWAAQPTPADQLALAVGRGPQAWRPPPRTRRGGRTRTLRRTHKTGGSKKGSPRSASRCRRTSPGCRRWCSS